MIYVNLDHLGVRASGSYEGISSSAQRGFSASAKKSLITSATTRLSIGPL